MLEDSKIELFPSGEKKTLNGSRPEEEKEDEEEEEIFALNRFALLSEAGLYSIY